MKKILFFIGVLLTGLLITGVANAAFYPSGGGTYRLQSSVGTANTTINLSSFKEPVSNTPYTMSYLNSNIECGTLDPQTTKSEFISFTGITQNSNGTAQLTGVIRGLGRSYPYAASTTLASSHSGQSVFILSDAPCLFQQYGILQNDSVITGNWTAPDPTAAQSLATRNYVDGKAFGGIGNASETATGTVQIATGLQTASSTRSGTLGRLVIPSSLSTSTWSTSVPVGTVPVLAAIGGTLDDNFIGSSTRNQRSFQKVFTTTGTSTWAVPAGVKRVGVTVVGAGATGGSCKAASTFQAPGGGAGGGFSFGYFDVSATTTIQVFVAATTTATTTQATWSTFGTNGFYNYATGGNPGTSINNPAGANLSTAGGIPGMGFGGTLNIQGAPGGPGAVFTPTGLSIAAGGIGGNSYLGFGAAKMLDATPSDATGYGAGGAATQCEGDTSLHIGTAATQGIVIINY